MANKQSNWNKIINGDYEDFLQGGRVGNKEGYTTVGQIDTSNNPPYIPTQSTQSREEKLNKGFLNTLFTVSNPVTALSQLPENAIKAVEAGKNFFSQSFFKQGEGNTLQNIGGTLADTGINVTKGLLNYAEDIGDFGVYKIADLAELVGQKDKAESMRKHADVRAVNALFGENELNTENIFTRNIDNEGNMEASFHEKLDKYSYFDRGMDDVAQGVGQLLGTIGTTELIGKTGLTKGFEKTLTKHGVKATVAQDYAKSLNTALSSYASAYGGTYESVRRAGYGDDEARKQARISGLVEAISEQLHDGIPGTKTAGWADKINKSKNPALQAILNSLGEVDEEVFGEILSTIINDVRFNLDPDNPYLQDINLYSGDILKDIYNNTLSDDAKGEYLTVFLSTLITNGMSEVNTSLERRKNAKQNPLLKSENLNQGQPIEQVKSQPKTKIEQKVQNVPQVVEEKETNEDELYDSNSYRRRTMKEIQSLVSKEEYNDLLSTINERDMSDEELGNVLDEIKGIDTKEKKALEEINPDSYRRTTMKEIQDIVTKKEYDNLLQEIGEKDMSDEELGEYLKNAKQKKKKQLLDKAKKIRADIVENYKGPGLTTEQAKEYMKKGKKESDIWYELETKYLKKLTPEQLTERMKKRNSKINQDPEILIQARQDMLKNKNGYDAISEANRGTFIDSNTAVDDIVEGKNKNISFDELYGQFSDTRKMLKEKYGKTMPLYRVETQQKSKPTKNYGDSEEYVKNFGDDVKKYDIDIDDILGVHIDRNGYNEEYIVLQDKYKKSTAVQKAKPTTQPAKQVKQEQPKTNPLIKQAKTAQEETTQEQPKKTTDLLQISKLTKEDANTTPKLPKKTYNKVGDGLSDQVNTLPNTQLISEEQKKKILEEEEFRTYDKITNIESLDKAFDRLNKNGRAEVNKWFNKNPNNVDATDIAEGVILMKQYADNNDTEGLVEVAKKFRDMKTKTAQTLQASSILSRLTPEGMVMYAQSELEDAYNELIKDKTKEWIGAHKDAMKLTSDDVRFIMDTMKKVSQMPDGYDKKVELAKIQKLITDKIEPDFTKSLKGWMRISMLFNPKTQVRNIGGNALIAPVNAGADIVASWADKLIAQKTGVRTTGNFKARNFIEGSKRGAYQSTNDFKLGINTRNMEGNRMEIGEGKSFSDKTIVGRGLNRVESILNYAMDLGDRVFSEGWFENSLQNQMELNGVDTPTQEMIDIANQEALQRTWNDNNNYTKFVLDIRRALNSIGGNNYGLGDVLIPFAKTPANLTKAIVDYSPAGMVNALLQYRSLNKAIGRGDVTSQQQHQFVQTLGKATAGSILYILGYALAKAGIITGEEDDDKDTKNFVQNVLGTNQYSIKIGDKSFTYDWAQPIAAPMTIMANIVNSKKNKEQALFESIVGSLDTAGSVLLEQSFLQSLNNVFSDNDNIVGNLVNEILELPARAVPTFSKQVADMVDGTQRQTYEKDKPVKTAINKFLVKIPGASKTLAPKVNTMGEDVLKYGGKNNIFNVMLNPANINKENASEAGKEIYKVYKATGNKNIFPRTAPYTVTMKNNEKVTLTTDQIAEFQRTSGTMIEKSLDKIINTSEYKNLSDDEKASVIKNIVDYSYNYASNQITGKDMASAYNKANIFVNNGGNLGDYYLHKDEADYSIDNPERYKAITSIGKFDDIYGYIKEVNEIKKQVSNDKEATINYVDNLDLSVPQKAILIKLISSNYKLDNYNVDIINYIDENIDNMEDKIAILNKLGFTVSSDGTVRW